MRKISPWRASVDETNLPSDELPGTKRWRLGVEDPIGVLDGVEARRAAG